MQGEPDPRRISTSYVERQNLTMRMGVRRFTRLTNAFSKRIENLDAAVSLHFMHYNFARPHESLKQANGYKRTPAMACWNRGSHLDRAGDRGPAQLTSARWDTRSSCWWSERLPWLPPPSVGYGPTVDLSQRSGLDTSPRIAWFLSA